MISLEELYQNYCKEIFDIGLDEIDFTGESFIPELIDMQILLELKGWLKSRKELSFDEFCEKLNSSEPELVVRESRFQFLRESFVDRWGKI